MTAIGKRFFMQGYRTPSIRQTLEHGEPGTDGGRLNMTLDEMQWWRIRSTPLIKEDGRPRTDPKNEDKWFTMPVQRFSWGIAGPIGDHWAIWNEIYYQPYEDDNPDRFAPGGSGAGANSRDANWQRSFAEVDEMEFVYGRELSQFAPGNYFGAYINDRGYRKVQNRGGTGIHGALNVAGSGYNGGVGLFGFWNDKYYANYHLLPGRTGNWGGAQHQLNLGWWPRNSQQDDLYMDILISRTNSGAQLGQSRLFGPPVPNERDEGQGFDYRVQYIKADWGMHTIDSEWGIGIIRDKYNKGEPTANSFNGTRTSGGVRYWYGRRYGGEFLFTRWLEYENKSDVTGEKLKYDKRWQFRYGLLYQFAANILASAEVRQSVGQPWAPGLQAPVRYTTYEIKLEFGF
jgi:hypothetical protein